MVSPLYLSAISVFLEIHLTLRNMCHSLRVRMCRCRCSKRAKWREQDVQLYSREDDILACVEPRSVGRSWGRVRRGFGEAGGGEKALQALRSFSHHNDQVIVLAPRRVVVNKTTC